MKLFLDKPGDMMMDEEQLRQDLKEWGLSTLEQQAALEKYATETPHPCRMDNQELQAAINATFGALIQLAPQGNNYGLQAHLSHLLQEQLDRARLE